MNNSDLDNLRHSCAHLLAAAVMELWPDTKRTIGPAIENGFYFDFEFSQPVSEADFPKIEQKMHELLKSWQSFERHELSAEDAKKEYPGNPYKHELIDEFTKNGEKVSFYKSGSYWDLCKGGHVDNPKEALKHFKLLSVAGAYWRGDEKNKMLTRIYGTAFATKEELKKYLWQLEEAKKRDHKKLGPQHELFMFHHTAPGMAYWLPKGVILYNKLIEFWRKEHASRGYQETFSPLLNKKELFVTSGHYDHYWQDMFISEMGENEVYALKAMNCPNAMVIFGFKPRSYKDLPLRLSDTDPLHRFELSGVLNGLFRVRLFRQDDAHIFVSADQIEDEFMRLFEIVEKFYSIFNLEYSFRLGKRPEKFMGDPKVWDKAEADLETILKKSTRPYVVAEKEGAFYGPKIDILMKDSLGRQWQMGTLQLDFQQPLRFKLVYTDATGQEKTPIAIHRVIYGSLERFIGILIEHYKAAFPVWISPVQIKIIPVSEKYITYARQVEEKLKRADLRTELDTDAKSLGYKIRQATLQKVPYMVIIGEKESASGARELVSIRSRDGKDLGQLPVTEFINKVRDDIEKYL